MGDSGANIFLLTSAGNTDTLFSQILYVSSDGTNICSQNLGQILLCQQGFLVLSLYSHPKDLLLALS